MITLLNKALYLSGLIRSRDYQRGLALFNLIWRVCALEGLQLSVSRRGGMVQVFYDHPRDGGLFDGISVAKDVDGETVAIDGTNIDKNTCMLENTDNKYKRDSNKTNSNNTTITVSNVKNTTHNQITNANKAERGLKFLMSMLSILEEDLDTIQQRIVKHVHQYPLYGWWLR